MSNYEWKKQTNAARQIQIALSR